MNKNRNFIEWFKSDPVTHLISILSLIVGILFIGKQGSKLMQSETVNAAISSHPIGRFDLGFAFADTFIPSPLLILGAVLLFLGRYRVGHLLIYSGWTINFYGMIVFFAGYQALGEPLAGQALVEVIATALLSLFCMFWSVVATLRERTF